MIEQGTLKKSKTSKNKKNYYKFDKELFLKSLLENLPKETRVISSTGYNSREIMHLRDKYKINKGKDFYMVGGIEEAIEKAEKLSKDSK